MPLDKHQIRQMLEQDFTFQDEFTLATYVDCQAAMLTRPRVFKKFLRKTLKDLGWPIPVATGTGGAIMLATVGWGYLWDPKDQGREWNPSLQPGEEVVLFADVKTTGGSLIRLKAAAEERGLTVIDEVVLYDMAESEIFPTVYLASPYSSSIEGESTARFFTAVKAVADLHRSGYLVYSPIVHFHAVAEIHDLPTDFEYWQDHNSFFMSKLDEVWVLGLYGWSESKGVLFEIAYAKTLGKPVFLVDPDTLERSKL